MGLDWMVFAPKDYDGPRNHRAKGLSWVFESMNYNELSELCYGDEVSNNYGDEEFIKISIESCKKLLQGVNTILEKKEFPEELLEDIEEDELLEHLADAKRILEDASNDIVEIIADS